jgi:mRNA interferase RelE/StbE
MKVLIGVYFEKDVENISDKRTLNSLADCIEKIMAVDKLSAIANCKKLKGSKNAYRIKIGDYRIGFLFENQTIKFIRFLHRNKIYHYFPH